MTYRSAKAPFTPGQWRTRHWQPLLPPNGEDDPVWVQRCIDYWELQANTYGVKFSPATMVIRAVERPGHPVMIVVSTSAMVLEVLPGPREVDYHVPQVAAMKVASEARN